MGMRERRQAIQQHLAEQRERANALLERTERVEPGRYTHAALAQMMTCTECGCVVADAEAHDGWHEAHGDTL